MTAKELSREMYAALNLWKFGKISDAQMKEFINAKDVQLCKEQRKICRDLMLGKDLDKILQAPMPEL